MVLEHYAGLQGLELMRILFWDVAGWTLILIVTIPFVFQLIMSMMTKSINKKNWPKVVLAPFILQALLALLALFGILPLILNTIK